MQAIASLICATSRVTARLVANLCVGLIFIMLGLLVTQVVMRYFLGSPPSWTEELAIILFAWLVLLYATVGLHEGFHVAIESIPARFERLQKWADRWVAGLAMLFGWVTLTSGLAYVERTVGQKTAALQLPIEMLYLCVPICGGLFILHGLARLIAPAPPAEART
ncbi:TRAP transporter small permease [Lutimaribacter sp. EGI FJ00015]|uniref:TRAP transporter small permease n=1 Tax=Lutimaribacter degradans TaxID=2945989 RepID=A0ACC5ZU86_9RHOB|nr:TRAP transporter small permease [Lutimaribacter sp. EGI FJ00013]MCM2561690.1 TRAP transporter small permease [Lutimaribacter sp. EGI FJ00013]MCO0612597.1 TRAP transporter small permease [Lutimaribacter sp. EGI FJ00015]MCO0635256.1 TRAP transporter small permease [Lutimaribacter sp. EGI FJ00014]